MDAEAFFDRYAVSTFLYRKHPLEEGLRRIAAAGFRWVELWADRAHLDPRLGEIDLSAVRGLLEELGLKVYSLHTPFNGLHLGQPSSYDAGLAREMIGEAVRRAGLLGASLAVVHPSSDPEPLEPDLWPVSRKLAQDLVAELTLVAKRAGTRLALENNVYRGFFRYGVSMEELVADFPDSEVGFCLDVGHVQLNHRDVGSEARVAGKRLLSVHVANNDGERDNHFQPMRGTLNWPEAAAAIDGAGYRGRFVLETDADGDADAVLATLKDLWQVL